MLTSRYSLIKEAYQNIAKNRFIEAIVILEKVIASGINDTYLVFLLAISYLFLDKFKEANIQIERLKNMDSDYRPLVQLETFLKVKSSISFESTVNMYLDLVERYPDDPYLYRGRKLISYAGDFTQFQREAKLSDFVGLPKPPSYLKKIDKGLWKNKKRDVIRHVAVTKKKRSGGFSLNVSKPTFSSLNMIITKTLKVGMIVLLLLSVAAGIAYFYDDMKEIASKRFRSKPDIDYSQIDLVSVAGSELDIIKKINKTRYPEFYHSIQEITGDFNAAKVLIKKGEYNNAILLLNKINNSNASFIVKEKVVFLLKFVRGIEVRPYEVIPYNDIMKKVYLYRGVAIKVEGRIANHQVVNNKEQFNILINYKKNDIFSGVAEVYSEQKSDLKNGDMIELNALFISTIGDEKKMYLVAENIMKI